MYFYQNNQGNRAGAGTFFKFSAVTFAHTLDLYSIQYGCSAFYLRHIVPAPAEDPQQS